MKLVTKQSSARMEQNSGTEKLLLMQRVNFVSRSVRKFELA